ncbi:MAG: hypothetical protein ABIT96_11430 [Ferruginibacter sp.]
MLKLLSIISSTVLFASCCMGTKCQQDYNSIRFRLLDKITGQDLVFGSAAPYRASQLKLYSLEGNDTIFHRVGAGIYPQPGGDSILFADFDYRKKSQAYLQLNNNDRDTLLLTYNIVETSCCESFTRVAVAQFNNATAGNGPNGSFILKK